MRREEAAKRRWRATVLQGTVVGHPDVWRTVDHEEWYKKIDNGGHLWSTLVGVILALAWFVGFAYLVPDPAGSLIKIAICVSVTFLLLVLVPKLGHLIEGPAFMRRIDAGFANSGWDVEALRAQRPKPIPASQARHQQRDRLFPKPPTQQ